MRNTSPMRCRSVRASEMVSRCWSCSVVWRRTSCLSSSAQSMRLFVHITANHYHDVQQPQTNQHTVPAHHGRMQAACSCAIWSDDAINNQSLQDGIWAAGSVIRQSPASWSPMWCLLGSTSALKRCVEENS